MPDPPAVSVVIPLWNKEREVERAIRSVLAQTVQDFEIVVVNDGSTDRGPDIVAAIGDGRIRLIHQDNQGVSAARNCGIAEARSDLIAFLDADDEWRPCFLEEVLRLRTKYPAASVFATNYLLCDGEGQYSWPRVRGIPPHPWDGILEDYFAIASRPLWTSAVAVTKAAIASVGGFPVGVPNGEDLLTWARLAAKCPIAYSTRRCAVFWRPLYADHRPGRYDDAVDVVGHGLRSLLLEVDSSRERSLRKYISAWHKMRASIFLQLGNPTKAVCEVRESAHFATMTPRLFIYRTLASLPSFLSKRLMRCTIKAQRIVRGACRRISPKPESGLQETYHDVVGLFTESARQTLLFENEGKHLHELKQMIPRCTAGARVLDVGGGMGVNLLVLSRLGLGCDLHLIDRFREYDEANRMGPAQHGLHLLRKSGISVVNQDFVLKPKLPYCDSSFDLVTCFDVVEHLPTHPLELLSEIRRVLKENGTLLLGVPNAVSLANRIKLLLGRHPYMSFDLWCKDEYYNHYREYTPDECAMLLEKSGFDKIEVETVAEPSRTIARRNFWKAHYDGYSPRAVSIRVALKTKYWIETLFPKLRQTTYCVATTRTNQETLTRASLARENSR